jgi:hypothetical protein
MAWVEWLWLATIAAGPVPDPSCGTVALRLNAGQLQYALPHTFLRAGTDSAWTRSGPWRLGTDYALDRASGQIRLLREPLAGDTLWVAACWLLDPPPLSVQLNTYRPVRAPTDTAATDSLRALVPRPITARDPSTAPPGTALTLSGNKSVAVDFGSNQDAFVRQSLDLAVSGTLAPGVELTGVLSDRNTPLTTTGTTEDLQSLDRVLLELHAPQGEASLGDVSLNLDRGEFGKLSRRLQGVTGSASGAGFQGVVAAASARGEYHVLEFYGTEGQQGPYQLTDKNGGNAVSVVASSEIVTLDGQRLTRGESADYSMDYERARLTFSNRRPITAASRITVEYQFTVNRFRRNLAAAEFGWERGPWYAFTTVMNESDDRGRPLDLTFDASDHLVLEAAGDSSGHAIGSGVSPGPGDYDLITGVGPSHYAYAGPDSGDYNIHFTSVGLGHGDYADSTTVAGRTEFRYVGAGNGSFAIGRALPLPDSHQLWSIASGLRSGPLTLEVEGAVSRQDLNTFSALDDSDNLGEAGSARLGLEGEVPGRLGGRLGLRVQARGVDQRFEPFSQLGRPFESEDWGLPLGADLEHQQRLEAETFLRPRPGGELRLSVGRLELPDGFYSLRRGVEWRRDGTVTTRASWTRADGVDERREFKDGGRDHQRVEVGVRLPWFEPRLRAEADERRFPSDTALVGDRFRELAAELASPAALKWHAQVGISERRDASLTDTGFVDQTEARTLRLGLESPPEPPVGASVTYQLRHVNPLAGTTRTRSDLASARFRANDPGHGLTSLASFEVTTEGENPRVRALRFVGAGQGAYDSLGNFVGQGDYDLVLTIGTDLVRVTRAATSMRAGWQFGESEMWRGSRAEVSFESEARRRDDFLVSDAVLSPGAALYDPGLYQGSVLQRVETELAPGSPVGGLRLRLERHVTSDRSFENFSQTLDDRVATARWSVRPSTMTTGELEGRCRKQRASQALLGGGGFGRALFELGSQARLTVSPNARVRAAAVADLSWVRPDDPGATTNEYTRALSLGPELGLGVGAAGRLEFSLRRGFQSGPAAIQLLPSADPAGVARWVTNTRFDYRVHQSTTVGIAIGVIDRPPLRTVTNGRAELRAFF